MVQNDKPGVDFTPGFFVRKSHPIGKIRKLKPCWGKKSLQVEYRMSNKE